ncbi:MAG: haloacid dehalogenase-like hydrolase [Nanoarchaeota archaeon]|nr:haloacid dehalogenase-like hydrolase [Nanoarchaeota archaeon]
MKNILIKNKKAFEQKLNKIKLDGVDNLHVIADFDKTLTKAIVKGQKTHTSIAQIREGGYLSEDYVKKSFALYDKYHPFEINHKLSDEEKDRKMMEWWSRHIMLLVEEGMNQKVVEDIIKKKRILLRKGAEDFFKKLHEKNIPLLIFSAGVGDIIKGYLESEGLLYDNMHIISNFFDYDKKGTVMGYKSKIIHAFNKDEFAIKGTIYFDMIKQRKNVILIGDSLGDIDMAKGIEHKAMLKIGFLNKDIEKNKDVYERKYDALILNDGPMDFVVSLIKSI